MRDKFTKADIQAVMTASGMDTSQARKLTASIIEAMAAAIVQRRTIEFRGFGTLESRTRAARKMRNPKTQAAVDIPARRVVFFRASGKLKRAINGGEL